MTYDLHGQWDTGSAYAQEGCDNGNCLRSHVNLTETKQSLAMITKAGVPGNKVIVGVTSYGRSFNMAEAGCWGPTCLYTGDRLNSMATPGKCTGTSGYIADAEIAEIMKGTKRDARVVTSFVDKSSNSDVLVYDNNQYVSYMSGATKSVREVLYANFGLGGTSDWATDLQMYNDAPNESGSWLEYIQDIKDDLDPMKDNNRTGNWTSLDCTNELIRLPQYHEAQDRWKGLYAADAWKDVLRIWLKSDSQLTWTDGSRRLAFSESVAITLTEAEGVHCEIMEDSSCDVTRPCADGMNGEFSGPAGMLIWNSLVAIHQLFKAWHDNVKSVMGTVNPQLGDFEDTFAPVPAALENRWTYFFIDLLTLGTLSIAAPIFNGVVKDLAFFKGTAGDNVKDTTMTLIGQSTTIAKDLIKPPGDKWTGDAQEKFSSYMGTVFKQWLTVSEQALYKLFDGSTSSLAVLSSAITNGKLISNNNQLASNDSTVARGYVEKTFFGFSIPLLWQVSDTRAFILDSGVGCGGSASLDQYMSTATADATGMCIGTSLYYLVYPKGESRSCKTGQCHGDKETGRFCDEDCTNNKFSIPPGLDSLNGQKWGGITMKDLIQGSYNTWDKNSRKNKPLIDSFADLSNEDTKMRLMNNDITTAGIIRLPVCSPDVAWQTWDRTTNTSSVKNYPCGDLTPPEGKKTCGEYEYENDWSPASPSIQDCLQILRNIEWDATTMWEAKTSVVDKIASYGSCAFSVEIADGAKGVNVNYRVGGQDLQNIINHVVDEWERDGKVGAFGKMNCAGNSVKQPVRWALH